MPPAKKKGSKGRSGRRTGSASANNNSSSKSKATTEKETTINEVPAEDTKVDSIAQADEQQEVATQLDQHSSNSNDINSFEQKAELSDIQENSNHIKVDEKTPNTEDERSDQPYTPETNANSAQYDSDKTETNDESSNTHEYDNGANTPSPKSIPSTPSRRRTWGRPGSVSSPLAQAVQNDTSEDTNSVKESLNLDNPSNDQQSALADHEKDEDSNKSQADDGEKEDDATIQSGDHVQDDDHQFIEDVGEEQKTVAESSSINEQDEVAHETHNGVPNGTSNATDESSVDNESELDDEEEDETSTDEESDDDEEGDEEEEDEEPRLKYTRITTFPKPVFNSDPVSTCIISDSYLIIATHGGYVHICKPDIGTVIRSYRAHRASVLALSTDGYYIASASMDGTVVVGSITDPKDIVASDFHRPVHTVALDPNYKSSKIFISGGMAGDVILSERGWLGNRSDTVIQHSDDPVTAVYWLEGLIICLDDSGINVFGQYSREKLLHIDRPPNSPRADLYKPRVCSPESNRIYIGWVDHIWNLKIDGGSVSASNNGVASPASKTTPTPSHLKVDSSASSKFGQDFFKKTLMSSGASMILPSSSSIRSTHYDPQVMLESTIQVDSLVAGISPFGQDTLMVLSYRPARASSDDGPGGGRLLAPPPEIRLIDLGNGEEVYADELSLKGYERLGLNDYHLLQYSDATSNKYFIISAKDGVVAVERDLNDRIDWLLEHKSFREAWDISTNVKSSEERLNIGVDWVETLLDEENWVGAAKTLKIILDAFLETENQGVSVADSIMGQPISASSIKGHSATPSLAQSDLRSFEKIAQENWNRWAFIFTQAGHSLEIAKVLPKTPYLHVDPKVYEKVLIHFLDNDQFDEILTYLAKWPCELYDTQPIKSRLESIIHDADYDAAAGKRKNELEKALADLYIASGDPGSAVHHLLELHDDSVLDLVSQYHLLPVVKNQIPNLMTISLPKNAKIETVPLHIARETLSKAISIVVGARTEVIPDEIVRQIISKGYDIVAFLYLEQLNLVDSFAAQKFGDLQVQLYSEFDRPKLLDFLKKNKNYNLEKALGECERCGYVPEQVYILGKVGQNKQALRLVIEKLQDPEQAIDFAKAQNDTELWDDLIGYCLKRPLFVRVLLTRASHSIDVAHVLELLPEKMQIPGIREAILHIFTEYELVLSLNTGILDIVRHEAQDQAKSLFSLRNEGSLIDFEKIADEKYVEEERQRASTKKSKTEPASVEIRLAAVGLDLSGSIVIKPDGTLINEDQLLGQENIKHLWPQGGVLSTTSRRSVSDKIKHLAYIKQLLRSQLKQVRLQRN